ncbi:hypothetical protein TrVGV298_005983 [Trichoderma virens]|nr:hypothetical protein TrVGV298_005983 [Trichoderma virens]
MAESQSQRRVAMDPPHLTEFASERYFEKLSQLNASRQQADHAEASVTTTATTSRFILPLRESSKPTDVDALKPADSKREKGRFLSFRQKVSLGSKHSKTDVEHTTTLHSRASTESTRKKTEAQKLAFAPQHERMRRRLIPLLFTTFHFFETYRKLHLQYIAEHGHGLQREPYTVNPIETQIMNMYDNQTLLRVHEVFPLIISSFCRRLRPPTYVGRVERSLRGYLRERPPDEVHVAILCLGGLRQVEKLWETKGYNNRRAAVDIWFGSLTKEPVGEASAKGRLGLKGFGRKKSTSSDRPPHRTSFSEGGRRSPWGSVDSTHNGGFMPYSVFNTSLSADAPMAPLERDNAKTLLGDLPSLQSIWLTTAEAMIMDRKIVQRPQDIKRNQQVMLDLIREDGLDEEDEWCYGRHISDSVRPPAAALGDDAD